MFTPLMALENLTHIDHHNPPGPTGGYDYCFAVHGDGNFVYVANSGSGLATYSVDPAGVGNSQVLTWIGRADWANNEAAVYDVWAQSPPTPAPSILIVEPSAANYENVEAVPNITVSLTGTGYSHWHWQVDTPFPASGSVGSPLSATHPNPASTSSDGMCISSGVDCSPGTHTVYVALSDSNYNLLSPSVTASHTFIVAAQCCGMLCDSSLKNKTVEDRV